jgi:predicted ester cyclase
MSAEENLSIARRFIEEQDRRKGPPPEELCAPGYTAHILSLPPMDLAGHAEMAKVFYAAFPDLKQTIIDAFANEEKAAVRYTITGTHKGELMGLAPTGKQVDVAGVMTFRIAGGKIEESSCLIDEMALMQQIGAIPSAEEQPAGSATA